MQNRKGQPQPDARQQIAPQVKKAQPHPGMMFQLPTANVQNGQEKRPGGRLISKL